METLGSRVRERREALGFSQKKLGEKVGLAQTSIDSIEKRGDVEPRRIERFAEVLGVSIKWLRDGKEENSLLPGIPVSDLQPDDAPIRQTFPPQGSVGDTRERLSKIVEIDARGGAEKRTPEGEMAYESVASWMLPEGFAEHELHIQPEQTIIVENVGDVMVPTLLPGDRVFVDTYDKDLFVDGLFAINRGGRVVIRRLEVVPGSTPEHVKLKADNQHHSSYTMLRSDIYVLGRVVGKFSFSKL